MINTPDMKGLLATKIILNFATCQMYLFVCLNHFYFENNKGSFFFLFFFFCCFNENEVIVVVAVNRQYLNIVHLVCK